MSTTHTQDCQVVGASSAGTCLDIHPVSDIALLQWWRCGSGGGGGGRGRRESRTARDDGRTRKIRTVAAADDCGRGSYVLAHAATERNNNHCPVRPTAVVVVAVVVVVVVVVVAVAVPPQSPSTRQSRSTTTAAVAFVDTTSAGFPTAVVCSRRPQLDNPVIPKCQHVPTRTSFCLRAPGERTTDNKAKQRTDAKRSRERTTASGTLLYTHGYSQFIMFTRCTRVQQYNVLGQRY